MFFELTPGSFEIKSCAQSIKINLKKKKISCIAIECEEIDSTNTNGWIVSVRVPLVRIGSQ